MCFITTKSGKKLSGQNEINVEPLREIIIHVEIYQYYEPMKKNISDTSNLVIPT